MLVKTLEDCCPRLTTLDLRRNQIGPKAAELAVKVCHILCDGLTLLNYSEEEVYGIPGSGRK